MKHDLNLPAIPAQKKQAVFRRSTLSIDEILNFMEFNLKNIIDLKAARKIKKKFSVHKAFHLY